MSKRKLSEMQKMSKEQDESESESESDESSVESEGDADGEMEEPEIEWPATVCVIAKKFAGKTNLLLAQVNPADFDQIYVFTASKHTGNLDSLVKDKRCIFESCSDKLLEKIIEDQKTAHKQHGKAPAVLLVWDDFLGMRFKQQSSKALLELATSGRNSNISMWISSQDRVGILTQLRRNTEYWFLGNNTMRVINDVSEEMALATLGKEAMREILYKISRNRDHEFLFLDDREQDYMVYKSEQVMAPKK
jgi:hypothetical protein